MFTIILFCTRPKPAVAAAPKKATTRINRRTKIRQQQQQCLLHIPYYYTTLHHITHPLTLSICKMMLHDYFRSLCVPIKIKRNNLRKTVQTANWNNLIFTLQFNVCIKCFKSRFKMWSSLWARTNFHLTKRPTLIYRPSRQRQTTMQSESQYRNQYRSR